MILTKEQYNKKYSDIKKYCFSCHNLIIKDKRNTYKQYLAQKFCSKKCFNIFKIEFSKGKNNPNWKGGKKELVCKQCNKNYSVDARKMATSKFPDLRFDLSNGRTLFCSRSCRSKNNSSGNRHWNWQGGLTDVNFRQRGLKIYKLWREAVFKRDGYKCLECGDNKGGNLNADHIKPFSLCVECHKKTNTWGGKIINLKKELNYAV